MLVISMAFIGSGIAGSAQAQGASNSIPSINLHSPGPGQLTITWATPEQTPTDYRIRWANTDLGFPSYRAANETERGNEYPTGDVNTLTLGNLTPSDSYKVQIRSRYYNADRSVHESSGPWTATVTQRVMDEPTPTPTPENDDPPAAPTGLTTSAVAHDSLTLSWNDPQDANITGYRILRGTAADSLSTIQADTGSNGTEYEDDTVAAETTYFYAVLALSAAGNGPQSASLSATTPAAPKSKEPPPPRRGSQAEHDRDRGNRNLEPQAHRHKRRRSVPADIPLLDQAQRFAHNHLELQHLRPRPGRGRPHRHPDPQLRLQGRRLHRHPRRPRQHQHHRHGCPDLLAQRHQGRRHLHRLL